MGAKGKVWYQKVATCKLQIVFIPVLLILAKSLFHKSSVMVVNTALQIRPTSHTYSLARPFRWKSWQEENLPTLWIRNKAVPAWSSMFILHYKPLNHTDQHTIYMYMYMYRRFIHFCQNTKALQYKYCMWCHVKLCVYKKSANNGMVSKHIIRQTYHLVRVSCALTGTRDGTAHARSFSLKSMLC